jgi:two-component system NtrC family sensor kinase
VEDTGCSISEDIMPKIFDPFFTTKGHGKGTGLGLSICYGIIKDHGGDITLRNTSDGAIAEVRLPASTGDISKGSLPERVEYSANRKNVGKHAYIMVIEDEENLLDLMSDVLSPYYYVMSYKNGKEALDHINDYDWGLIISDLRMPEMDGMEFYEEALKSKSELKDIFVFITGDTYDVQVRTFFKQTGAAFIKKPFKIKEIIDIVQRYVTDKRAEC